MNVFAFGLLVAPATFVRGMPERTWRIETPGEPPFTVRLPAVWRPDWRVGGAGKKKKGVETTPFFGAPDGSRLVVDLVPNASEKDRRAAYEGSFVKAGKTERIVGRKFVRGRWTGVAVAIRPATSHPAPAGLNVTRASMNVIMSDGRAVRTICVVGPQSGALPSEALTIRICETIAPLAKR